MYETSFSLTRRPFAATADAQDFVDIGTLEEARQAATSCIERASGTCLVVGSPGTGKTLLCRVLADQFRGAMQVAMLYSARLCTRRALLQAILFELGLPYREREEGELRLSLIDHLTKADTCPGGMLLLIDEAHTLPLRLLEEVRMITNLVRGGESRVRLVLAGTALLEERLASPRLESLNQRIAARCYLETMTREETGQYISRQIQRAGGDADSFFPHDARSAVYDATAGIPRLVNQVCDHALIMAVAGGHACVTADVVQESWADLQQLPAPVVESPTFGEPGDEGMVIEFGNLDELAAEPPTPAFDVPEVGFVGAEPEPATDETAWSGVESGAIEMNAAEQLDRIEELVAAADDEQTAPVVVDDQQSEQVEVVFHGVNDPFAEAFDQEEAVDDPYASMADQPAFTLPIVKSDEGQAIADLLDKMQPAEPAKETVDEPAVVEEPQSTTTEPEAFAEIPVKLDYETMSTTEASPYAEFPVVEIDAAQAEQQELSQAVTEYLGVVETEWPGVAESSPETTLVFDAPTEDTVEEGVAAHGQTESVSLDVSAEAVGNEQAHELDDDRDLIVIDHPANHEGGDGESPRPTKKKYGQLFARLRQA